MDVAQYIAEYPGVVGVLGAAGMVALLWGMLAVMGWVTRKLGWSRGED